MIPILTKMGGIEPTATGSNGGLPTSPMHRCKMRTPGVSKRDEWITSLAQTQEAREREQNATDAANQGSMTKG